MQRSFDRATHDPRPIRFERHFTSSAPGSVLASFGGTRVLCTAVVTDGVPGFLQGKGKGWLTAEYAMLPSSTNSRKSRDRVGKIDGRSIEIQRLIGRALRTVTDLSVIGERTVWVDCDVVQADGGTRTTAITGAWVALCDLFSHLDGRRQLRAWPLASQLAAVSVGIVDDQVVCDLDYAEDSRATVDMNLVKESGGSFVEVQGGGEGATFPRERLDEMLAVGEEALAKIFEAQRTALGTP
ncbi:MAG: ribonuclease PH [Planctomycetota bacterium]